MCGLSSLFIPEGSLYSGKAANLIGEVLVKGQVRGMDATGIALHKGDSLAILREALKASDFIKTPDYKNIVSTANNDICVIGHNRLATNGGNAYIKNNQPIAKDKIACVQNGIITNASRLMLELGRKFDLDTYLILELVENSLQKNFSISDALNHLWEKIEGENNIILQLAESRQLVHTTNTGSLYYVHSKDIFLSCSEKYILQAIIANNSIDLPINQLLPNCSMILDYAANEIEFLDTSKTSSLRRSSETLKIIDMEDDFYDRLSGLRRCKKCILPETFPGISFDEQGICNQCLTYEAIGLKPIVDLEEIFDKYRKKDGSPDCLVAFSGGRDSCYGLHLIKNKYKMNPVAYSYDWGMVTDLARRNQSRMCGKLGIEHVWVSADIKLKRNNIRKNVNAWMASPHIGMVPLFMAGDKTYFYHANRVMKNMDLELIIFCPNNLERTNFKAAYCGVKPSDFGQQVHHLKLSGKLKLLSFYAMQYLKNSKYINSSMLDVLYGFLSYYVMKQDFLYLFDYEKWDEKEIDSLLRAEYDWEWDPNYPSSWRIGDGTAPLYNMIYFLHSGFTENDCFRSNQIREGVITREEALSRAQNENIPRLAEIEEYCKMISVNFVDLINAIRKIRYR